MSARCDNCKRFVTPDPVRVTLIIHDKPARFRSLCRACAGHVEGEWRKPAPWISPPVKVTG